ncbi:hypothetical protein CVT24_007368 [Panaeolus cyanescens]|uniref:Uncharacterized protein n=1 Tax=Panaeolus cyanescens TaxID=181874 RepID=A0A409YL07_9AGAR|nr:hypothetical protein CVT24_007368 [Panaeolus cyanescens]
MFADPPTKDSLADAQRVLSSTRVSVQQLNDKIDMAEEALERIVRESRAAIEELVKQREALKQKELHTLAYLSPIRRLPTELLREIFMWSFESHPCIAWVLASVCTSWRRLALRIPRIWSKIRILTTQHASADTIRLWLERSGDKVPLDIEIFLRIANTKPNHEASPSRPRRVASPLSAITPWNMPLPTHMPPTHLFLSPPPPPTVGSVTIIVPPSPPGNIDAWGSHGPSNHDRPANYVSKASMHWGHIAFFYLVEQMHRWERFVFRFDKQFTSMGALKSITGDAPLLKEFEVSSVEAAFFAEWPWLPNAGSQAAVSLPNLRTLTLQHTPFKWSSPMLKNLHTLNLRALPTSHLPLDRILGILANNPLLKNVSLHFQGVLQAVLPVNPLTLPHVTHFSLGGHFMLTQLLDSLTLPALRSLTLDIEARDPIEDVISSLLGRSSRPPVEHLSIAYGVSANAANFYYGPGGIIITWTALLGEVPHLKSLNIGGTSLEPLLTALGPPEDDPNQNTNTPAWACPKLEVMGLRSCNVHGDGVAKLVQMVNARNPDGGAGVMGQAIGGVSPKRLRKVELHECQSLGEDVMRWLEGRIGEVVCCDPTSDR